VPSNYHHLLQTVKQNLGGLKFKYDCGTERAAIRWVMTQSAAIANREQEGSFQGMIMLLFWQTQYGSVVVQPYH